MNRNLLSRRRRSAFTLIELMVVMALTMFIMAILSQSFGTGLDTFRQLKGIGDLQDGLRTATTVIRNDLVQDHFEGKRRLSDPNFWSTPVREGFFAIRQGSPLSATAGSPYLNEGVDSDGLGSQRAVDHVLHFSVRLRGNRRESNFYTNVPAGSPLLTQSTNLGVQPFDATYTDTNLNIFGTQWAEVGYYLVKTGTVVTPENPGGPGTPLFSLYRCQLVGVATNQNLGNLVNYNLSTMGDPFAPTWPPPTEYGGVSWKKDTNNKLYFYSPNDWASTSGARAFPAAAPTGFTLRSTLVLGNVVSFQVQGLPSTGTNFTDIASFDTASANPGFNLQAVQITIRVFDPATRQTRQVTIMQDL